MICANVLQLLECILGWDFLLSNQLHLLLHDSSYFLEGRYGKSPILPAVKTPLRFLLLILPFLNSLFIGALFHLLWLAVLLFLLRSKVGLMTRVPRNSRNALGMVASLSSEFSPSGL